MWEWADCSQGGWLCWIYHIDQCSKFPFNMAILLRSTWGSVFKLNTHLFLFASPFKICIFSGITTSSILYINTIPGIQIFLLKNNSMQNYCCLLWPANNSSYCQKRESKVSWCQRTAFLLKFWFAQQPFTDSTLFGLSQGTTFTGLKHICEVETHRPTSDSADHFQRMA